MAEFPRIPVSELVATGEADLKTGPFGTQLRASEYTEHGIPVINVRNIGFGGIRANKLEFISTDTRDRLSSHILRSGDIVFGRKGAVERHVFVRVEQNGWFQGSDCLRLRFASQRVEPLFASYYFLTSEHQRWMMNQCSHGATMASLNQEILERIELPLPSLPIQRRIAGILSAYDELIENSQRRIRILETMARALYREWFVHFRFPGHDHPAGQPDRTAAGRPAGVSASDGASPSVPRVPSPLGEIPEGWEVKKLGEIVTMHREGINPSGFPSEQFEHFSIPSFDEGRMPAIDLGATILSNKYLIDESCVLLSKLNPRIPRVWLPSPTGTRRTITSTEFLVLRPKAGFSREFIYAKCCSDEFAGQFASLAIGTSTSHQRVKPENLLAMPSTVPSREAVEQFTKLATPILSMSEQLRAKTQTLRRTRDLLLPRLLSGQIDVEAIAQ